MLLLIDEMRRFRMVVAGIMVALAISTMYGFSMFTEKLKDKYGFTQGDITTISTVSNVLGYCAFLFGILLDYAGPKVQLLLSGSLALVGLILFGLALDDKIHSDNQHTMLILISIFNGIMYLGCPSLDGCSVLPLLMNFPVNRGHIIIIEKTFAGLGTSILMAYFNAYFKESTTATTKFSAYAYFLGVQAMLCSVVGAIFIDFPSYSPCDRVRRHLTTEEMEERTETLNIYVRQQAPIRRIVIGCCIVIALLIHLTVSSIVGSYAPISRGGYYVIWVIAVLGLFAFSLMALPLQWLGHFNPGDRPSKFKGLVEVDTTHVLEPVEMAKAPEVFSASGDPQYQGGFWSHLRTLDLWLFWLSLFSMWGTSTVLQFNSAQVYRSKNWGVYSDTNQSFYVAIIGVGSALGRISGGVIDLLVARARAAGKKTIYTTMFFPFASVLLALGFLLIIVLPASAIVLPLLLASMGNGLAWGLAVVCVRLVYAEDMGKHYNFMFSSGIIATIGLNRFMFGGMFDDVANQEKTSPSCNIPRCITRQMWVLFACNVVSALAATLLHFRFSRFSAAKLAEVRLEPVKDIHEDDSVRLNSSGEWDELVEKAENEPIPQ